MSGVVTAYERALYAQAIHSALYTLVNNAEKLGRGWYHYYEDGKLIVEQPPTFERNPRAGT